MFQAIKKFFKIIFILLIILLIGAFYYRYKELKESGELDKFFSKNNNNTIYVNAIDPYEAAKNSESDSSSSDESSIVLEKKDYDDYYNKFNFDDALLVYEGEQKASSTEKALERLIEDADDSLYSKPTIVFQNFNLSKNEIGPDNLEEYKSVLNEAKNSLGNGLYTFSFEYSKFNATVNKIIITKN